MVIRKIIGSPQVYNLVIKFYKLNNAIHIMKLQNIKSKEVIKILQRQGFEIKRQSGTHVI